MLSFALLSLALAILIWLACYAILFLVNVASGWVFDDRKMMYISWVGMFACFVLIAWGIWFIAHRWPAMT
jgi:hypothetical protein